MIYSRRNEVLFAPIGSGGSGGVGSGGGGVGSGGGGVGSGGGGIGSGGGGVGSAFAVRSTALNADGGILPDANLRRTDLDALHPVLRDAVVYLTAQFTLDELPFRLFEAFRTPQRQTWLYAQGRTRPGSRVTNAQAWQSYHQYGLAADFVLWINSAWSWSTVGAHRRLWTRLHELGRTVGLEPLSWELPHLQVTGLRLADLRAGQYPDGGDDGWRDNLEAAVIGWTGTPTGPTLSSPRPPVPEIARQPAPKKQGRRRA